MGNFGVGSSTSEYDQNASEKKLFHLQVVQDGKLGVENFRKYLGDLAALIQTKENVI